LSGATVSFGGRFGTTNAQGNFTLTNVAYATNSAFGSIQGTATNSGYFDQTFSAEGIAPNGGVVNVGDVQLLSNANNDPPPGPFNIWGNVLPKANAQGTTVTISQNGTDLKQYTVGSDGRFYFWMPAGTYTLSLVNGTLHGSASVTLTNSNVLVQKDVTISS